MKILVWILSKIILSFFVGKGIIYIYYRKIVQHFKPENEDTPLVDEDSSWTCTTTLSTFNIVENIRLMAEDMNTETPIINLTKEEYDYLNFTRMESGTDTTIMKFIMLNNYMNIEFKRI